MERPDPDFRPTQPLNPDKISALWLKKVRIFLRPRPDGRVWMRISHQASHLQWLTSFRVHGHVYSTSNMTTCNKLSFLIALAPSSAAVAAALFLPRFQAVSRAFTAAPILEQERVSFSSQNTLYAMLLRLIILRSYKKAGVSPRRVRKK